VNVLGSLRRLVNWVLGADLSERPQPTREPDTQQQAHRASTLSGDGFDAAPRTPRVVLDGSVEAPARVPDEPQPDGAVTSRDFMASFDDLKDLVDEPLEPQPEFIPEGGMSTESLMREFEALALADAALEPLAASPPMAESPPLMLEPMGANQQSEAAPVASSATEAPPTPVDDRLAPAWLIPATTASARPAALAPTDFNASLDDLAAPQLDDPKD
jgi:hypothetical protein